MKIVKSVRPPSGVSRALFRAGFIVEASPAGTSGWQRPSSRISRSTVHAATRWPWRRRYAVNRSGFDAASSCEQDADHVQALPGRAARACGVDEYRSVY
jgi:hypothetical protein